LCCLGPRGLRGTALTGPGSPEPCGSSSRCRGSRDPAGHRKAWRKPAWGEQKSSDSDESSQAGACSPSQRCPELGSLASLQGPAQGAQASPAATGPSSSTRHSWRGPGIKRLDAENQGSDHFFEALLVSGPSSSHPGAGTGRHWTHRERNATLWPQSLRCLESHTLKHVIYGGQRPCRSRGRATEGSVFIKGIFHID